VQQQWHWHRHRQRHRHTRTRTRTCTHTHTHTHLTWNFWWPPNQVQQRLHRRPFCMLPTPIYITSKNETCYTSEWVMSHMQMSHVTHINESRHVYKWVMSRMRIHSDAVAFFYAAYTHLYLTSEWVMSHVQMSHVTRVKQPCHTCEWVMTQMRIHSDAVSLSVCRLYLFTSHVTHSYVWHDSFLLMSHVTHVNESWHAWESTVMQCPCVFAAYTYSHLS